MPVRIEAVCGLGPFAAREHVCSRDLAVGAARRSLEPDNHDDVRLIVYAGTYREEDLLEPAVAPFIQRELVGGPDTGAFAFDVDGLLAGCELTAGLLQSGHSRRALIVAADRAVAGGDGGHPGYATSAAALLLGPGTNEGFVAFNSRHFPEHRAGLHSLLRLTGPGCQPGWTITQSSDYASACATSAADVIHELIDGLRGPTLCDVLIVPSQSPSGLPQTLAERLRVPADCVARIEEGDGEVYTAGPLLALARAMADGRVTAADWVVFVTVSPGVVVHACAYRKPAGVVLGSKCRSSFSKNGEE